MTRPTRARKIKINEREKIDQPNTNNAQATYIYITNSTKKADTNTHTQKKGKQDEGRTTNTHCVRVRGLPNGTNSHYTKETATEQEETKGKM